MVKYKTNTKYPLLLFIADKEEDVNLLNKTDDNGRFAKISSGARQIMTQWHNYIITCWSTFVLSSIIILFLLTIMILSITNRQLLQVTRCNQLKIVNNQSIYLVHNYDEWQNEHAEFLKKIIEIYPNYQIYLTKIVKNHQSIIKQHNNVVIKHLNYKEIFDNTPLYWKWLDLSTITNNFLVRIVDLWKYGGLSFDFALTTNKTVNIDDVLMEIRENYENLNDKQLLIDKNGLYIGGKIPCHSFYGRILMLTNQIDNVVNIEDLLKQTMVEYCDSNIIQNNYYCNKQ